MEFTQEQIVAIYADNRTLLVSAAAGSGKTAVLVERIVRLVLEGDRLSRMLIVTFTRAAAAEMKERLRRRLLECAPQAPERIDQALADLDTADIGTIHSFCQRFLREEFQAVGIDPMSRVCRDDEGDRLFDESARDALNALLADDPAFPAFAARFTVAEILAMVRRLYGFLMSMDAPFAWLGARIAEAEAEPVRGQAWMRAAEEDWKRGFLALGPAFARYAAAMDDPRAVDSLRAAVDSDGEAVARAVETARTVGPRQAAALLPVRYARAASVPKGDPDTEAWHKEWNGLRQALKDAVGDLRRRGEVLERGEDELARDGRQIADSLRCLQRLTERTHAVFTARKREERVIDFTDMEQLTCALLTDPDRPEYRERWADAFDHIFVDECQDVSRIQDSIIQALQGDFTNLFLVGDVKQSIYRFRQADPTLFLGRIRSFSREKKARERAVFLTRNFRSAGPVIDAVNAVFERAMTRETNELDYTPEDRLVRGRDDAGSAPVAVRLLTGEKGTAARRLALSVDAAVREIRAIVGTPRPGGGRYRCGDVAVLMPRLTRQGEQVARRMKDQGVPVYYDGRDSYFELPEVRAFHSLLTLMQNPSDDIACLAVLKTVFRCTDEELARIRARFPKKRYRWHEAFAAMAAEEGPEGAKAAEILRTLGEWRFRRDTMRLHGYVWYLLRESGLYAAMGARPGGEQRQGNLRIIARKADDMESRGKATLADMLREFSEEIAGDRSRGAHVMGENEDCVRLMTIHKSKGLQFPVVILLDLDCDISLRGEDMPLCHRSLGVCLPYVNRDLGIRRQSYAQPVFVHARLDDERAERCRLLYVAMTRAQERLAVILHTGGGAPASWSEAPSADRAARAGSMADWVMQAVSDLRRSGNSPFEVTEEEAAENPADGNEKGEIAVTVREGPNDALTWWDEPAREGPAVPAKTSVSSLVRRMAEPSDDEETADDKRRDLVLHTPMLLTELPAEPAWLREEVSSGARRGTANHRFLSLVPLDDLRAAGPERLLSALAGVMRDMRERGVISEEEAGLISLRGCAAFFASEIGQAMLSAERVEREWRFNLRLAEGRLVQGIADAAFLAGGAWTLVDYKTDAIESTEAFVARHAEQLNWYGEAVRRLTGQPVRRLALWSLSRNEAFDVPVASPMDCFT